MCHVSGDTRLSLDSFFLSQNFTLSNKKINNDFGGWGLLIKILHIMRVCIVNGQKLKRDWAKENLLHGVWRVAEWLEGKVIRGNFHFALVCQQHSTISSVPSTTSFCILLCILKVVPTLRHAFFYCVWLSPFFYCRSTNQQVFLMKDSEKFLLSFIAAPSKAFISFDLLLSMQQRLIYARKMSNLIALTMNLFIFFSWGSFQVQSHYVQCFFNESEKKWSFVIAFTWQSIFNHLFFFFSPLRINGLLCLLFHSLSHHQIIARA